MKGGGEKGISIGQRRNIRNMKKKHLVRGGKETNGTAVDLAKKGSV